MEQPPRRVWASAFGEQACQTHGMTRQDIYLSDASRMRGFRGFDLEVVGDLPPSLMKDPMWRDRLDVKSINYHDPSWARDWGHCLRCDETRVGS